MFNATSPTSEAASQRLADVEDMLRARQQRIAENPETADTHRAALDSFTQRYADLQRRAGLADEDAGSLHSDAEALASSFQSWIAEIDRDYAHPGPRTTG